MIHQCLTQLNHAVHFRSVSQFARRIDSAVSLAKSPGADGIEILESESNGIHNLVAGRARGIDAMLSHLLAHGSRLLSSSSLLQRRHVGRRWRNRQAENVFKN